MDEKVGTYRDSLVPVLICWSRQCVTAQSADCSKHCRTLHLSKCRPSMRVLTTLVPKKESLYMIRVYIDNIHQDREIHQSLPNHHHHPPLGIHTPFFQRTRGKIASILKKKQKCGRATWYSHPKKKRPKLNTGDTVRALHVICLQLGAGKS